MNARILQGLAALTLLLGGVLIAGALQRGEVHVERSAHVDASTEAVYAVLHDLHRFEEWSPWAKLDPDLQAEVQGGARSGLGAKYTWIGNDEVGSGTMTIVDATPHRRLEAELLFVQPWQSRSRLVWSLAPDADGCRVTWVLQGNTEGLLAKTMGMFLDIDKLLGKDFAIGLARLKHVVERR